jgi:hypothetical protein
MLLHHYLLCSHMSLLEVTGLILLAAVSCWPSMRWG